MGHEPLISTKLRSASLQFRCIQIKCCVRVSSTLVQILESIKQFATLSMCPSCLALCHQTDHTFPSFCQGMYAGVLATCTYVYFHFFKIRSQINVSYIDLGYPCESRFSFLYPISCAFSFMASVALSIYIISYPYKLLFSLNLGFKDNLKQKSHQE